MHKPIRILSLIVFFLTGALGLCLTQPASAAANAVETGRVIYAEVVALDQVLTYNRFGSFNPYGMIYALRRDVVDNSGNPIGSEGGVPGQVRLRGDKRPRPLVLRGNAGDILEVRFTNLLSSTQPADVGVEAIEPGFPEAPGPNRDAPATRLASMMASGLETAPLSGDNHNPYNTGMAGIAPGQTITYRWKLVRDGSYIFVSNAAPAGGEGDGGSVTHGLFGSINVQPAGSGIYRSQVTQQQMDMARAQTVAPVFINYEAVDGAGDPILNMLKPLGQDPDGKNRYELIHGDLNALITGFDTTVASQEYAGTGSSTSWYREFTVIFHDELKTFHPAPIQFLDTEFQLAGVRDGFGMNYGAAGLGAPMLFNRLGIGPAKSCVECAYEDFFLESWANGDPALLAQYADDPSNVHHSYMGDNVRFRNMHAGPKETHVFHLHAHQWIATGDNPDGSPVYLDSQTIAPMQGFSYDIYYGGSGNRNKTVGDSIFHCHLYPHFAQGMWELWRTHDVFEDGSRRLPDGELGPGTDPYTGVTQGGTYIPAIVPMPGQAMPPQPTYMVDVAPTENAMPGYPFYIAGNAGHRSPQAPMDIHEDAGLPRHVFLDGDVDLDRVHHEDLNAADFSIDIHKAHLRILPQNGTPLEQAAMRFHGEDAPSMPGGNKHGYETIHPDGHQGFFQVNGHAPQPGAPFADPCIDDELASVTGYRDYHVSAIELDLQVNNYGWHDPQARINVLDTDVSKYEGKKTQADPFFFRANSGECVTFYHTNRTPKQLQVDDFQVKTPTDIIGQHIHLVKFDVTSSDGSGNGWNYEDGTYARQTIEERIAATQSPGGSAEDIYGNPVQLQAKVDSNGDPVYQTTVQRWWADPYLSTIGGDRTIGTVFTHDHFAPSSIQQHGFYNAMLVEPAGSEWLKPNGDPLLSGVGTQAIIQDADDQDMHPDHREFAMAVADYALIYTSSDNPVDPPFAPEAISADHHNPYLVNYRNEPPALRMAEVNALGETVLKPGMAGDMAHVFDSHIHGDPSTELFRAYEGDLTTVRLIQGAQEVQHNFGVVGAYWKREAGHPDSPYVSMQEIGISEHFEMQLPRVAGRYKRVGRGYSQEPIDFLYHFGSSGDIWNGDWGLIRNEDPFAEAAKPDSDPTKLAALQNNPVFTASGSVDRTNIMRLRRTEICPRFTRGILKEFNVQAWAAQDLLAGGAIVYNARDNITDPSGLLYIQVPDNNMTRQQVIDYFADKPVEPLVLRANAGDCIKVHLKNMLPPNVPDHLGDAGLPKITPLRVDDIRPSNQVSLVPQLVAQDLMHDTGVNLGYNDNNQTAGPGETMDYTWYAGRLDFVQDARRPSVWRVKRFPEEFGAINLNSYGDIIKHGA
ncbi:MAG: copper oxidase, partial [Nitrospinaceae bacterium]